MAGVLMPERRDTLGEIAKAVNIAGNLYGIYADTRKLDQAQEEQAKKAEQEALTKKGIITPDQEIELYTKGFAQAPEGKGTVKREMYDADGKVVQRWFYDPQTVKAAAEQQTRTAAQTKEDASKGKEAEDRAYKVRNDFETSTLVKKQVEAYYAGSNAKQLLNSNTPVSLEVAKNQIARLGGEVGALTDSDIARYEGSKDVLSRMERRLSTATSGEPMTAQDKADLYSIIDVFQKKSKDAVRMMARRMASANAKYTRMNPDELYNNLNPDAWFLDPEGVEDAVAGVKKTPGMSEEKQARGVQKVIEGANKVLGKTPGLTGEAQATGGFDPAAYLRK